MWFPKIKKIEKLNLLKSGLNGGQKGILFFVHVNMNVSRSDAGRWKTLGGPVVIGGDNLPSLVQIGLTDLQNIGGASGPPGHPGSGTTAFIQRELELAYQ